MLIEKCVEWINKSLSVPCEVADKLTDKVVSYLDSSNEVEETIEETLSPLGTEPRKPFLHEELVIETLKLAIITHIKEKGLAPFRGTMLLDSTKYYDAKVIARWFEEEEVPGKFEIQFRYTNWLTPIYDWTAQPEMYLNYSFELDL